LLVVERVPDAAEIGAAVSSDFPEVLASLVALAEQKCNATGNAQTA